MKISQMKPVFKIAQLANDSIRMIGRHGIGKSQVVEDFAKENDYHIETLFLSQQEVADLIGIPENIDHVTYWSKPVWLKRMEDANAQNKHCILFLDELARAPLEVRQAALQLVLEGRIHEHKLPTIDGIKTLVVAADNPSDLYQTEELDKALDDRFGTYNVEVDVQGWLKWASENDIAPVITDFIAEYPDKLHFMPEDENDKGATPRAWAKLSSYIKNFNEVDVSFVHPIILSKIGDSVGNSFFHFFNNYVKILKPQDIEKMLGKEDISTKEGIQKGAKKISKKTNQIEALAAQELANKLRVLSTKDRKWENILTTFLDSINVEVMVSIIKTWKEDEDTTDWYFDWSERVPEVFLFTKVLEIKNDI